MDFTVHPLPDLSPILRAIASSSGVKLFEGLPHQNFESEMLAQELASHRTVRFASFPFYEEAMEIHEDCKQQLTGTFRAVSAYGPFTPGKLCGGFHPDFAVEWSHPETPALALICFGCGECLLLLGEAKIHCDMSADSQARAYESLRRLRKNRPVRKQSLDPTYLLRVTDLRLTEPVSRALELARIGLVGDLIQRTRSELIETGLFSEEDLEELVLALAHKGLTLGTRFKQFSE
jgi:hypothetical protein